MLPRSLWAVRRGLHLLKVIKRTIAWWLSLAVQGYLDKVNLESTALGE